MSKKNILIVLAVVIVVAAAVLAQLGLFERRLQPSSEQGAGEPEFYLNKEGEKWMVPAGKFTYQVASSEGQWPKFLQGFIDPLKVFPGLTQRMSVVVQSPAGIESVVAQIETDNGINTVPLTFTGIVAARDMIPERYVVNGDGTLEVLSPLQIQIRHLLKIAQEEVQLANIAQAQNEGQKEAWGGEWVVRDTHEREYRTTFVARDKSGRENTLTMAWSDPCGIPFSGHWTMTSSCSIDDKNNGVQNGKATICSGTNCGALNLYGDFALAGSYFEGDVGINAHIVMNGGSIVIADGPRKGKILLATPLYMEDADSDSYPPDIEGRQYTSSAPGMRLRVDLTQQNDCYDLSAAVNPGQTAYFTGHRGDGSFDYNCNGSVELQYGQSNCTELIQPNGTIGFNPMVTTCGGSGNYWLINAQNECSAVESRTQGCR